VGYLYSLAWLQGQLGPAAVSSNLLLVSSETAASLVAVCVVRVARGEDSSSSSSSLLAEARMQQHVLPAIQHQRHTTSIRAAGHDSLCTYVQHGPHWCACCTHWFP
jgi:hypothetical protein